MARPREFDREQALQQAMQVFWAKGFAATSTDDLLQAMGIGRQSLYNAYGDKRQLYLEALAAYQQQSVAAHLQRLRAPVSPLQGIGDLLAGLAVGDDRQRALGCMGVGSVCEFGVGDPELVEMRKKHAAALRRQLRERLREGQAMGEIDASLDVGEAAAFVQMSMTGIQLAARAGAGRDELRRIARFATDRLRAD